MQLKASTVKQWFWLAVILGLFFVIYQCYPVVLYKVLEWQKSFNQILSASLAALKQNESQAGISLVFISFLYGVFHAVGPGHGKFILSSYLSLEQTKLRQVMIISLLSSLAQGVVAVTLVSIIVVAFTLSRSYFNLTLKWVERGSFILMICLGMYWLYQVWKSLRKPKQASIQIKRINFKVNLQESRQFSPLVKPIVYENSEYCGCGHQHLPTSLQMTKAKSWKAQCILILSIGARPCSGAILVLFLAYTLDLYAWGVLSAFAMAIGTGITLSLFAILVLLVRQKAVGLSRWYFSAHQSAKFSLLFKLAFGFALILFGVLLLHSSFIEINTGMGLLKR